MNRIETVQEVLRLEGIAAAATARAGKYRDELDTQAREELAEQGTAPTWRLPELGTIALPVSKAAVYVSDIDALKKWVEANRPSEITTVTEIRASYQRALLDAVVATPDGVLLNGEVVPGLSVRPGGVPQSLRFTIAPDVRQVYAVLGDALLDELGSMVVLADATKPDVTP